MFGANAAPQQSAFSFSSAAPSFFGSTASSVPPATAAATNLFSFTQPTACAAPQNLGLFGAAPASSSGFMFGGQQQGKPVQTAFSSFQPVTTTVVQQPAIPCEVMQINLTDVSSFVASLYNPQVFGDDRDKLLAKFNQLQAFCGQGRGVFSFNAQPVAYSASNPFCRFKAICYNSVGSCEDCDGLVSLIVKKPESELRQMLQKYVDDIYVLLGAKPQVKVNVEAIRALPNNRTELIIFVTETSVTGGQRRILASELHNFLSQANYKQHMVTNLGLDELLLKVKLQENKMREYLATPQEGIDAIIWHQAVLDNPDPKRLIPQPILGFAELYEKQKLQNAENDLHQSCLKELSKRLEKVEQRTLNEQSRLEQLKTNQYKLANRLVSILGRYLVHMRRGYAFEMEEENLKTKIDALVLKLNGSNQLQSQIAELKSALYKPMTFDCKLDGGELNEELEIDIKQFLRKCQESIEKITATVKTDKDILMNIQRIIK